MSSEPDPTVKTPLRLETFLPWRLNVVASRVSHGLARVYSERFGIDIPEWRILATLGQFGAATAKAIGTHSCMHKTKVSRAVAGLETRGLVARSQNPKDLREAILLLTPAGQATYEAIVPLADRYQRLLEESLPEGTLAAFDRAVESLMQSTSGIEGSMLPEE
jgi:DNA-binding MarR family transcriptional regulator